MRDRESVVMYLLGSFHMSIQNAHMRHRPAELYLFIVTDSDILLKNPNTGPEMAEDTPFLTSQVTLP